MVMKTVIKDKSKIKKERRREWKSNLAITVIALLAVGVFCYWRFSHVHIMAAREQSQLFLWTPEYFTERLAVPGGIAQYIGEFLVQFFVSPTYGALIYAALFLLSWWLSWIILRNIVQRAAAFLAIFPALVLWWLSTDIYIPMTPIVATVLALAAMCLYANKEANKKETSVSKRAEALTSENKTVGTAARSFSHSVLKQLLFFCFIAVMYWLIGPIAVLLVLCPLFSSALRPRWLISAVGLLVFAFCVVGSSWLTPYPLQKVARGIDYHWDMPLLGTEQEMAYDLLVRQGKWAKLAERYKHERPESQAIQNAAALAYFLTGQMSEGELRQLLSSSGKVLNSQASAFLISEVYMHTGLVNMSQRAAFEGMEAIPNHNKSGRALRRLTETALITGQTDIARKYIGILRHTTFYRSWANKMLPYTEQPDRIAQHPTYSHLRDVYAHTSDAFFY